MQPTWFTVAKWMLASPHAILQLAVLMTLHATLTGTGLSSCTHTYEPSVTTQFRHQGRAEIVIPDGLFRNNGVLLRALPCSYHSSPVLVQHHQQPVDLESEPIELIDWLACCRPESGGAEVQPSQSTVPPHAASSGGMHVCAPRPGA